MRNRRVYVHRGYAYVPHTELVVIILSVYRSHLSRALAVSLGRNTAHVVQVFAMETNQGMLNRWYLSIWVGSNCY